MNFKLKSAIKSRDIDQRILCFDRCQLTITWMSSIKEVCCKPRLFVSVSLLAGLWPPSCATPSRRRGSRPRALPLAMITTRKSIHGCPLLFYMAMGLRLVALRDAGGLLKLDHKEKKLFERYQAAILSVVRKAYPSY